MHCTSKAAVTWRLGKFVRRHRLPVALSVALGLALCAGVAGVAWQTREA